MEIGFTASGQIATPPPAAGRQPLSRSWGFQRAITRVGSNARAHLSSLMIVVELIEAYEEARALARKGQMVKAVDALNAMLHDMVERAHVTGDPLPYKPGVVDLSEIVRRAAHLAAAQPASHDIDVHMDMLAPLVVPGDERLLAEAFSDLIALLARRCAPGGSVLCTAGLANGMAIIDIVSRGRRRARTCLSNSLHPFSRARGDGAARMVTDLTPWIARMVFERHGGIVMAETSPCADRIEIRLPGRLL